VFIFIVFLVGLKNSEELGLKEINVYNKTQENTLDGQQIFT
jgi:hypothetical protein